VPAKSETHVVMVRLLFLEGGPEIFIKHRYISYSVTISTQRSATPFFPPLVSLCHFFPNTPLSLSLSGLLPNSTPLSRPPQLQQALLGCGARGKKGGRIHGEKGGQAQGGQIYGEKLQPGLGGLIHGLKRLPDQWQEGKLMLRATRSVVRRVARAQGTRASATIIWSSSRDPHSPGVASHSSEVWIRATGTLLSLFTHMSAPPHRSFSSSTLELADNA
jgi:hypothetical protein